jgi:hypothetical protein
MEKTDYSQLELFSPTKQYRQKKAHRGISFLGYIANYEKIILIIIGFMVTGIIAFSLGVEKGKKIALLKTGARLDTALKIQATTSRPMVSQPPAVIQREEKAVILPSVPAEVISGYTIQLATYKTHSYAQKEAEALKKKGFLPLILSKSGYAVLCVGKFSSKESAKSLLSELKKRYHDCLIRRL